jgi:hypothetical protein
MKDAPALATAHLEKERLIAEQVERAAQSIADRYRGEGQLRLVGNGVFHALASFALRRGGVLPGDAGERLADVFRNNDALLDVLAQSPASAQEIAEGVLGFFLLSRRDLLPSHLDPESLRWRRWTSGAAIFLLLAIYFAFALTLAGVESTLDQIAWVLTPRNAFQLAAVGVLAWLCVAPLRRLNRMASLNIARQLSYNLIASRYSGVANWQAKAREVNDAFSEGCGSCLLGCLSFVCVAPVITYLLALFLTDLETISRWGFIVAIFVWVQCLPWLMRPRRPQDAGPANELARHIADWRAQDWPAREES